MSKFSDDIEKDVLSPNLSDEDLRQTEVHDLNWLDRLFQEKLNAEVRGIEHIPEEERHDVSYLNAGSMWLGANLVVATFSLGTLGITTFGCSFWDSVLTIIFFNILGALPVAYYSTFGPKLGLRQMVMSRFWFGYQGIRVVAFLNCIACIGWTAVNTMVSAQILHTVNNGSLPPWGGVLVITLASLLVAVFGYKIVHAFEKFAWIPNFIIFIIIAVRMSKTHSFDAGTLGSGPNEAAAVLSFGGTIFGYATGWSSYAADYTCYMPKSTSRIKVFFLILFGLSFPLLFAMILGAACATGINTNPRFASNYNDNQIGGLLYAIMVENSLHGFGQFCQVILALSTISNNIPNLYSLGLSAQTVWSGFRKVPRIAWSILGCGVSVALAIPAYYHFADVMSDFMDLIGYWLAFYSAICLSEHLIYRKSINNYDPLEYENKKTLPIGIAAIFAMCCGVAGAVVGMSQVWYVGPIAIKIGDTGFGGDIGFELAFAFAFIGFNSTRWLELKYFGR
ncbi:Fcy2p [Sugiyamaella lignohabitans]|uniref:Fcy2p n=1 Tax=Sugiyamaella lignohabitans TaxID=796027 RepID=A0A167E5G7_9ASCO|nr:Fcy2p [Sugiyamaella lignohabitans]ANB13662.1 Fcy2p [Sugiyamaella lignohabitans]